MDLTAEILNTLMRAARALNEVASQWMPALVLVLIFMVMFYTTYIFLKVVRRTPQLAASPVEGAPEGGAKTVRSRRGKALARLFRRAKKHVVEVKGAPSPSRPLPAVEGPATRVEAPAEPKVGEGRAGPAPEPTPGPAPVEDEAQGDLKPAEGQKLEEAAEAPPSRADIEKKLPVKKISFEEVEGKREDGQEPGSPEDLDRQRGEGSASAPSGSEGLWRQDSENSVEALLGGEPIREAPREDVPVRPAGAPEALLEERASKPGSTAPEPPSGEAEEIEDKRPAAQLGQEAEELASLLGKATPDSDRSEEGLNKTLKDLADNLKKLKEKLTSIEVKIT